MRDTTCEQSRNQRGESPCFSSLVPGDHVLWKEPKYLGMLLYHHIITCTPASSFGKMSGDFLTKGELPNPGFACLSVSSCKCGPASLAKMPFAL